MDTTGKSRAEIDALRALAAKAHEEGAVWSGDRAMARGFPPFPSERMITAALWAAEELPYPVDR